MKVFFVKYNDPIYVKLEKLDIMIRLASQANIAQVGVWVCTGGLAVPVSASCLPSPCFSTTRAVAARFGHGSAASWDLGCCAGQINGLVSLLATKCSPLCPYGRSWLS